MDETAVRLWDLRSQAEVVMRGLTRAQRHLELHRDGDERALAALHKELAAVVGQIRLCWELAQEAALHTDELLNT